MKLYECILGNFSCGRHHGFGELRYANGDIYKGQWFHGMRHGMGTYWSGSTGWTLEYTGQWGR